MDEMAIDIEQACAVLLHIDQMGVPDFVVHGTGCHFCSSTFNTSTVIASIVIARPAGPRQSSLSRGGRRWIASSASPPRNDQRREASSKTNISKTKKRAGA